MVFTTCVCVCLIQALKKAINLPGRSICRLGWLWFFFLIKTLILKSKIFISFQAFQQPHTMAWFLKVMLTPFLWAPFFSPFTFNFAVDENHSYFSVLIPFSPILMVHLTFKSCHKNPNTNKNDFNFLLNKTKNKWNAFYRDSEFMDKVEEWNIERNGERCTFVGNLFSATSTLFFGAFPLSTSFRNGRCVRLNIHQFQSNWNCKCISARHFAHAFWKLNVII